MTGIEIAIILIAVAMVGAVGRMAYGPSAADRIVAADLLVFAAIAQFALIGIRGGRSGTFDLVLVATLVAFLAGVSFGRLLGGGRR